jgi:hypothetical protein
VLADLRAGSLHHQHLPIVPAGTRWLQSRFLSGGLGGKIQRLKNPVAHCVFRLRDETELQLRVRLRRLAPLRPPKRFI